MDKTIDVGLSIQIEMFCGAQLQFARQHLRLSDEDAMNNCYFG